MQPAYTTQRLPEEMSPHDVGVYMAQLRTQFNLTQQEVSERLHIRARYISAIEEARFDQMPGLVYARGYVFTYAEFLGLDAEQVVALCFGKLTAVETANHRPPPDVRPSSPIPTGQWRGIGVAVLVVLGLVLVGSQIFGSEDVAAPAETAVAPVPEEMLQSVRNLVMPTPGNNDCLTTDGSLRCFYSDAPTRLIAQLEVDGGLRFLGDFDVSQVMEPVEGDAEGEVAADAVTGEEKPAASVDE